MLQDITVRALVPEDEPFLWEMLYYAARMSEDGAVSGEAARDDGYLRRYVEGWGKETDMGSIAMCAKTGRPVGAAWMRLLERTHDHEVWPFDAATPELAIAVEPPATGQGVGTALLAHALERARRAAPAVALSVRATNPARRLYERAGFVVAGEVVNRVGSTSLLMVLRF